VEIRRSINSRQPLFCMATIVMSFVLGYVLLVSIDKIEHVSIKQIFLSTYTVFTQFGMLIFPVIIIQSINGDYKDKNILFYRRYGIGAIHYYLGKLGVIALWFLGSLVLVVSTVSILYGDFSQWLPMFIYLTNALAYIILVASLFAFIFKSILVSFFANLLAWIASIIVLTAVPSMRFIAYFDASNSLYKNLEMYLSSGDTQYLSYFESTLYNLSIFILAIVVVFLLRKRWITNGI